MADPVNQFSDLDLEGIVNQVGVAPPPPLSSDPQPATGSPSIFNPQRRADGIYMGEVANMTFGGLSEGYRGMKHTIADALNAPAEALGYKGAFSGDNLPLNPAEMLTSAVGLGVDALAPRLSKPDSELASAGRSVIKFLTGAFAGLGAARAIGGEAVPAIQALRGGFIGDFMVAGKGEDNLSNLLEEVPALSGPITQALAATPDDTKWETRFKAAIEGLIVGPVADSLLASVKVLRGVAAAGAEARAAAKAAGKSDEEALEAALAAGRSAADNHADDVAKVTDTLSAKPGDLPEQLELFPDVVRREENIRDVQVLLRGDKAIDPVTGREAALKLSDDVAEELQAKFTTAPQDGQGIRLGALSEKARGEVLAALRAEKLIPEEALSVKHVKPRPYQLKDDAREAIRKAIDDIPEGYSMSEAIAYGFKEPGALASTFNVRYMADSADVQGTLDAFAKELKPMIDARRGGAYMSFKDAEGLADWLGMNPRTLLAGISNAARHSEMMQSYVIAGKVWMQSLTADIARISRAIDAGTATGTAEVELARRMSVLEDLVVNLKGLQTSAARTTAIGRIRTSPDLGAAELSHLLGELDRVDFKIVARKIAAAEGDTKAIVQMVTGGALDKTLAIANEVYINGLLASIKTHVVNTASGFAHTLMLPTYRMVGGLLTWDRASMVEGASYLRALKAHIGDAFVHSGKAFRTESSILDTAYRQIEVERHSIKAETFNLSDGNIVGQGVNALGIAVRMPSRFLTAEDEFLKQLNYRASVTAKASRDAYERGLRDDILVDYYVDGALKKVSQVDAHIMDRMAKAFEPAHGFALDDAALRDARRVTFTQPLKAETWITGGTTFGERVQQMAGNHPLIRHFVLPFVRVPVNIMREAQELTPLAPLKAQWWADYKAGGAQRADAVGRMAIGTMAIIGGSLAVAEGKLTGGGPADPELKRALLQKGWQPYSIRVGEDENGAPRWLSFQRADPWATVLGIIADAGYVFGKMDEKTETEFASSLSLALANALNSRSYLRGLTDIMSALGNGYDKEGRFEQLLVQRLASYIPAYMRDVAMITEGDAELKRTRTVLDGLMARVPGMSDAVEAQRDNFGRKRELPMGVGMQAVNPFALSTEKPSRPYQELAYWAESPIKARFPLPHYKFDGNIDLTQFRNARTGQSAWDRWMELHDTPLLRGRSLHEALDEVIGSETYNRLKRSAPDHIYNDHPALRMLRDTMDGYREVAFERMLKEDGFEPLREAIFAYRMNRAVVPINPDARRESDTLEELLKRRK